MAGALIAAALLLMLLINPSVASAGPSADALFAAGDFGAAAAAYADVLAQHPSDLRATLQLGAIRLYENDLFAAEPLLRAAAGNTPPSSRAVALLAELQRRKDEATRVSTVSGEAAVVPFVTSDPLPVVQGLANGKVVTLLVDTGATVALEPDVAASLSVTTHDAGMGTFAGGRQAPIKRGMLQSLALGAALARDVPVSVLPSHAAALFGSLHIDGVVGTTFFERFLVTMDFPNKRLVLRPRSKSVSDRFEAEAAASGAAIEPCWLVGDHFVFARAQVNNAPAGLFLFDSGLAGGGVMPTKELIDAAGIALDEAHAGKGMGGGGPVTVVPFIADRVAVGSAEQRHVAGSFTPEGSPFGMFPFTVWGAISNDFLVNYAYTVDFEAMRIVLSR